MKYLILLSIFLINSTTFAQVAAEEKEPSFVKDFAELTSEEKVQWQRDLSIVNHLFKIKRIDDCLAKLKSLNKRISSNPAVHNLMGACHVENREFKNAVSSFKRALRYEPDNLSIAFNLAEIEFVTKDYKTARIRFEKMRRRFKKEGKEKADITTLCQFKVFLCHLVLGDEERVKKVAASFEADQPNKPAYFYSQMALSIHGKDLKAAEKWLEKAENEIPEASEHSVFKDSLTELGYMNKKQELILPE